MTAGPVRNPEVAAAIDATVRDYYEGWFEGNADRMRRALHPRLVKRGIRAALEDGAEDTAVSMIEATEIGVGTQYGPELRRIDVSVNHVHGPIADVHVTGDVYVDYLHLVLVDGRWQIINALWAPA